MIDMYIMIWHLKFLNLKTILRPSIVGGMPLNALTWFLVLTLGAPPGLALSGGSCYVGTTSVYYQGFHGDQGS